MKNKICPENNPVEVDSFFCDEKKVTGYTLENGEIVAWDPSKHQGQGFIKYISHPFWKSTTGDPYDDFEKIKGNIDNSILQEARHPLVAACPEIGVEMEKLILSKNENLAFHQGQTTTTQTSNTISKNTSNSHNNANSWGVSGSADVSTSGFKVSVSANYSHNSSNTISVKDETSDTTGSGKSESWTNSLNISHSETAFLNGNVRYSNYGTAPIYNVKPTINFVLGSEKKAQQTVATVSAKRNTIANVIFPDQSYPEKSQNAIAFNTNDDFNSHPIALNFEQVEQFDKDKVLRIETIQISGAYGDVKMNSSGLEMQESWELIFPQIYNRTACITISFDNNHTLKRRIAARKTKDYEKQYQPELTIKQAVELAFPGAKIDGNSGVFSYKNVYNYQPHVVIDHWTEKDVKEQGFKIDNIFAFNAKLKQGMNILIVPQHDDQELFALIKQFFEHFDEKNRIDLMEFNPNETWKVITTYLNELLLNRFGDLVFKRVKNFSIINDFKTIAQDVDKNQNDWKNITFNIGNIQSGQISLHFKNILKDEVLSEQIRVFLLSFNSNTNNFDLSGITDVKKTWITVWEEIKKALRIKFGHKNVDRITFTDIRDRDRAIEWHVNYRGQVQKDVAFRIGNKNIVWVTMKFKNIAIEKVPDQIEVPEWKLFEISNDVSGDTWGGYYLHSSVSKEISIIEFIHYRQESYQDFVNKYPNVDIKFDSYIKHWDHGIIKDPVKTTLTYKTADLFKTNVAQTTTDVSSFYFREFITGGTQGYTQIHTSVKNNQFFIKTSAHAGGGGNSSKGKLEQASIQIENMLFYKSSQ